jgi:hypothetical protein
MFAYINIGFVFSNSFSQYASRITQYEINWLCFLTNEMLENYHFYRNLLS